MSDIAKPTVSVLITTFNRSRLLRRAINSVLMQNYDDFEIVIIDDASTDDTLQVVASYSDPRIRYIRNRMNVGAEQGDRVHMRRFIYDLMRGTYWVYLCDDDYWLYPDLLRRQVTAFGMYDNVAMVMGGQLSYFLSTPESYFGRSPNDTITLDLRNIAEYFDCNTLTPKTHHFQFMQGKGLDRSLFSKTALTSEEFLEEFAEDPTTKNIIGGAILYSREHFIRAGGFAASVGSQWQAGYELKIGPACFGRVIYLNEPLIVTEVRASNASFRKTQVDHYLDSVISIEAAFATALACEELRPKWRFLRHIRAKTIRNLGRAFLGNTITIRRSGKLSMCDASNMSATVTWRHVLPPLARNQGLRELKVIDFKLMIASGLPEDAFRRFAAKYFPH